MHPQRARSALTLIELLIAVAIIALLVGILLPALAQSRRAARSAKCLSNMRQIAVATLMYCGDNDGDFPRTMDSAGAEQPATISWWSIRNYQGALNAYIQSDKGGISDDGLARSKNSVWFDPADPDAGIPAMWGSFLDNGFITGTRRKDTRIPHPSDTIYATLREQHWTEVTGIAIPAPLPIADPDHPFWSSIFFDMCLDPWAPTDDPADPFHWSRGRAIAPASVLPDAESTGIWDQVIESRHPSAHEHIPRYNGRQPYSFCDGHVEMLRFEATFQNIDANMWDAW